MSPLEPFYNRYNYALELQKEKVSQVPKLPEPPEPQDLGHLWSTEFNNWNMTLYHLQSAYDRKAAKIQEPAHVTAGKFLFASLGDMGSFLALSSEAMAGKKLLSYPTDKFREGTEARMAEVHEIEVNMVKAKVFSDFFSTSPIFAVTLNPATGKPYTFDELALVTSLDKAISSMPEWQVWRSELKSQYAKMEEWANAPMVVEPAGEVTEATTALETSPEWKAMVSQLLPKRVVTPQPMHVITVDEIIEFLTASSNIPPPELPEGVDPEDLLERMSMLGIPEETKLEADELKKLADELSAEIDANYAAMQDVLTGVATWEKPKIGVWASIATVLSSPFLAVSELLQPYFTSVNYPLAGLATYCVEKILPGKQETEKLYEANRASGMGPWAAFGKAWNDTDLNGAAKFAIELLTDPLTFTPGIALKVPGNVLIKLGTFSRFFRPLEETGHFMIKFNQGLYDIVDIPFNAFKSWKAGWGLTHATQSQVVRRLVGDFKDKFTAAVKIITGKEVGLGSLTVDDLRKVIEESVKAAKKADVNAVGDAVVATGRSLMEFPPLTNVEILAMAKAAGANLTLEDITMHVVEQFNNFVRDAAYGRILSHDAAEYIGKGLFQLSDTNELGRLLNAKFKNTLTKRLRVLQEAVEDESFGGVNRVIRVINEEQEKIIKATVRSQYADTRRLSGTMAYLVHSIDKVERMRWRMALDRMFVKPVALMYLGTWSYFSGNVLEGVFNSAIEGVLPRRMLPEMYLRLTADLVGEPKLKVAALEMGKWVGHPSGMIGSGKSIMSLRLPEVLPWIGGKDLFHWVVRKPVEWSDSWGTGYRWNFVAQKMAQKMAQNTLKRYGYDLTAAFEHIIREVPDLPVASKALNLKREATINDVRKLLAAENPAEEVRRLGGTLTNQGLKIEAAIKFLRAADWIPPQLRLTAEEMARRGEIWGTIRVFPRKLKDWNKIVVQHNFGSGTTLSAEEMRSCTQQISKLVEDMPTNLNISIKKIIYKNNATLPNASADWDARTKTLRVNVDSLFKRVRGQYKLHDWGKVTIPHEIYHVESAQMVTPVRSMKYKDLMADVLDAVYRVETANNREHHIHDILKSIDERAGIGARVKVWELYDKGVISQEAYELAAQVDECLAEAFAFAFAKDVPVEKIAFYKSYFLGDNDFYFAVRDYDMLVAGGAIPRPVYGELSYISVHKFVEDIFGEVEKIIPKHYPVSYADQPIIAQKVDSLLQEAIKSYQSYPVSSAKAFTRLAADLSNVKIQSSQELEELIMNYRVASLTAGEMPHKMLYTTWTKSKKLFANKKYGEVRALWETDRAAVRDALVETQSALESIRVKILDNIDILRKATGDEPADLCRSLLDSRAKMEELLRLTLEEDGSFLDDWWRLSKAQKIERSGKDNIHDAWNWAREQRETIYAKYRAQRAVTIADEFVSAQQYVELFRGAPARTCQPINAVGREMSKLDIANIMGCNVDGLCSGIVDAMILQDRDVFVKLVKKTADGFTNVQGVTEEKIGKVYDDILHELLVVNPEDIEIQKMVIQAEALKKQLIEVQLTNIISPDEDAALVSWIKNTADKIDNILDGKDPRFPTVSREGWKQLRQESFDGATKEYYKVFADYTHEDIISAAMKFIFPFWTYHSYRWFWIPYSTLKHPGLATAWGRYYNYSDEGRVRIPGTDFTINPCIGTVAGVTFGLARHDYPAFYGDLPFGETIDFYQRWGFFPGPHVMTPLQLIASLASGRPLELGQVLPPIGKIGLALLSNSKIPGVQSSARWLQDKVFHDNYRDYTIATIVSKYQSESGGSLVGGQSGLDLWWKIMSGEKLSDEEQSLWTRATEEADWYGAIRAEFPLIIFRPQEMERAYKEVENIIYETTGVTPETQQYMRKHNMRPTDVVGGMPINLRIAIDQMWQYQLWIGRGQILASPEVSDLQGLIGRFWNEVEGLQVRRLDRQRDVDVGFVNPTKELHFNGDEWRRYWAESWSAYADNVDVLKTSDRYTEAVEALTPEGRVELLKRLGYAAPVRDSVQELIDLYFSIELGEPELDPVTGEYEYDYLGFWLKREAVRKALSEDRLEEFDAYITRYSTPVELAFKYANSKYFRGYKAVGRALLANEYTEEQRDLILEYYKDTTSLERKDELREIIGSDGNKLIAGYESKRRVLREQLRVASPTLDFWLYVFGYTTKPMTDEARAMVNSWDKDRSYMFGLVPTTVEYTLGDFMEQASSTAE